MNNLLRNLSERFLYTAEWVFLVAHGWTPCDGRWTPPTDYPGKPHARTHGHAINSQRYYSRNPLMRRVAEWR